MERLARCKNPSDRRYTKRRHGGNPDEAERFFECKQDDGDLRWVECRNSSTFFVVTVDRQRYYVYPRRRTRRHKGDNTRYLYWDFEQLWEKELAPENHGGVSKRNKSKGAPEDEGIDITITEEEIRVDSPYHRRFVELAHNRKGNWTGEEWVFPARNIGSVLKAVEEAYHVDCSSQKQRLLSGESSD